MNLGGRRLGTLFQHNTPTIIESLGQKESQSSSSHITILPLILSFSVEYHPIMECLLPWKALRSNI